VRNGSAPGQPRDTDADVQEEAALVRLVRNGDVGAFDVLVRRYLRRAYAIAYRLLGHREDAEDLMQEAFMTALDRIETFDLERPFAPWFFRILTNQGLNARKARAIRRTEAVPETVDDERASPQLDAERAEIRDQLRVALDGLPERQRFVVQMVDVEGMQANEVATMLGLSPGTVRWYLHQARATLRSELAAFCGDE
jgi:RNA polymerase sigma-70 factor (ECF subfamily)